MSRIEEALESTWRSYASERGATYAKVGWSYHVSRYGNAEMEIEYGKELASQFQTTSLSASREYPQLIVSHRSWRITCTQTGDVLPGVTNKYDTEIELSSNFTATEKFAISANVRTRFHEIVGLIPEPILERGMLSIPPIRTIMNRVRELQRARGDIIPVTEVSGSMPKGNRSFELHASENAKSVVCALSADLARAMWIQTLSARGNPSRPAFSCSNVFRITATINVLSYSDIDTLVALTRNVLDALCSHGLIVDSAST
jgi:hypothetical protein